MKGFIKSNFISTKIFVKDNIIHYVFITILTLGIGIGAFSIPAAGEHAKELIELMHHYFNENTTLSFMELFSRNLITNLLFLAVIYLGGLCAIGLPAVGIIPLFKGISLGAIISYKYVFNGLKGFLYVFVMLLLPASLLLAVYSLAYHEGIYMSLNVSNGIFNGKPRQVKYALSFATFSKRFIIFALAVIFISGFETVLFSLFSKLI